MPEHSSALATEFLDEEYRYAYAEDFLNTWIATQIVALREQRGLSQTDLGKLIGTKQPGVSRLENVNHSTWKTETLKKIARALGVRLRISFETFGTLLKEDALFNRKNLQRPEFKGDPAFAERDTEENEITEQQAVRLEELALARDESTETEDYHLAGDRARSSEPHPMSQPDHVAVAGAIDRQAENRTTAFDWQQTRRSGHASLMELISGNCKSQYGPSYPPVQP